MELSIAWKSVRGKIAIGSAFIQYGSASIDCDASGFLGGKAFGQGWRQIYINRIRRKNIDVFTKILEKIREILRCTNPKHMALRCA